jgi:membrane-bound lytic murein transglycosylase MltF
MITALTALIVSFGCPYARAESLASDVAAVVATERPLFAGADARRRTARLLAVWAWHESSGRADAIGDGGRACGVMQLHEHARNGTPCEMILRDRRLGLRLGLRYMRQAVAYCGGSITAGLSAYASGICRGAERVDKLVHARMRRAK